MGRRRSPQPAGRPHVTFLRVCPDCGHNSYASRSLARRAAKAIYPGRNLRAYPCGQYWHFGQRPDQVRGRQPRPKETPAP